MNTVRAVLLGLTNGRLVRPPVNGPMRLYFGRLTRMSAAFAIVSDAAMATLGGQLKRRERISGRLADALAWMYLGFAALKRYTDAGQPARDLPFVQYACSHALHQIQTALVGVLHNLPNRFTAWALWPIVFPLGVRYRSPDDAVGAAVARGLLEDQEARLGLTEDIYIPPPHEVGLGRLEAALAVETKIRDAVRAGRLDQVPGDVLLDQAAEEGIITPDEHQQVLAADELRRAVIQVDAFGPGDWVDPIDPDSSKIFDSPTGR